MTATILQIPNEEHLARVRQARRECGLPINFAEHPFRQLWSQSRVRAAGMVC